MSSIPLFDLAAQHAPLRDAMLSAITRIVDANQFIGGPEIEALEDELARYCGVGHAIGCSSGSDALLLALTALDIGAEDAVITVPHTFFATAGSIARTGARPIFIDIDPGTQTLDPDALARYLAEQTDGGTPPIDRASGRRIRAVIPVHLWGQCADMAAIGEIARAHGLRVIEDAAQAIGAATPPAAGAEPVRAGAIGDIGCFSFYPSKNLGAAGDAGAVTTNDAALAARIALLRVHGAPPENRYHHDEIGWNARIDAIQAAALRVKLPHVDAWNEGRRDNAAFYDAELAALAAAGVHTPAVRPGSHHVYHLYVLRIADDAAPRGEGAPTRRDRVHDALADLGVGAGIYYAVPLHLQPCFVGLGMQAGALPVAEQVARESLAIPVFPELGEERRARVVEAVRTAVQRADAPSPARSP